MSKWAIFIDAAVKEHPNRQVMVVEPTSLEEALSLGKALGWVNNYNVTNGEKWWTMPKGVYVKEMEE